MFSGDSRGLVSSRGPIQRATLHQERFIIVSRHPPPLPSSPFLQSRYPKPLRRIMRRAFTHPCRVSRAFNVELAWDFCSGNKPATQEFYRWPCFSTGPRRGFSSTGVPIRVGVIPSFCILNHNTNRRENTRGIKEKFDEWVLKNN